MSYLINLKNVTKHYQLGDNQVHALKNINFQIEQGEMTAVVGTSGSGKSTLMNIIGFLDRCSSGEYWYNNKSVSNLSEIELASIRNQKIGFVFQSFFLLPRLSALQNIVLPLLYRNIPRHKANLSASVILEKLGVAHLAHHKPLQLSGGQQQRMAIARALIGNPEVILADEPTGALDSNTSNEVMDLFTQLNRQEGKTIIIITHDKAVSARCNRVVTIKDGCII